MFISYIKKYKSNEFIPVTYLKKFVEESFTKSFMISTYIDCIMLYAYIFHLEKLWFVVSNTKKPGFLLLLRKPKHSF